jgi:hypothetical protein
MSAKKSRRSERTKKAKKTSVATTRSRAGPGYAFEDQIGGYLLLQMMMGEAMPGFADAIGSCLQSQTKELGWFLDDLLATSQRGGKPQRRVAVSCKSSAQVSAAGLPKDFVLDAWKQWCQKGKGRMVRGQDCLLLATRGYHPSFAPLWADIKLWSGDAELALARIAGTARHLRVFESVRKPINKLKASVQDEELIAFIRHLEVLPTDFDLPNSDDRRHSVARCRNLLKDGSLANGNKLWLALVDIARDARLGAGTIELGSIIANLSGQFDLKDHPSYASSWLALEATTANYKKNVESALPTKFIIDRSAEVDAAATIISQNAIAVLYGESGSGKSALAKTLFDQKFSGWRQVWFGPDQFAAALRFNERAKLGLTHPLSAVLEASGQPDNILIIDAAERLPPDVQNDARDLLASITKASGDGGSSRWRAIIVGQTEAWADGAFQAIAGTAEPASIGLRPISEDNIKAALQSSRRLGWAASHDEVVAVLSNLRTLAWVLQAEIRFQQSDVEALASPVAIADHLWRYWTDGKVQFQNLLIRFAEREANFEHSFEVSKLDPLDAAAFDGRPARMPLRINPRNRIEFEHDLAAQWSRFQRLKEIADQPEQWASYADRPLWTGALRMLGSFLLRETVNGANAWDVAFEKAESQKKTLAADILLDALCLDPLAETFLSARADLLLKDHGRLLDRLLKRFQHIATTPGDSSNLVAAALNTDPTFTLYVETQFRTPVVTRWPAIARFLGAHRERVAALVSMTVAASCHKWLTSLPATFTSGAPIPLRREFAEVALATARALQLEELKRDIIYAGDFGKAIFPAALAGAPDLPTEVSAWALEMARRRPLNAESTQKLNEHRQQKAREHQEKLESDPEYRQRVKERRDFPRSISSSRKLPPWPLGPKGVIDRQFSECCANGGALTPLMRVRPDVAAEVLLAVLIEGDPEEGYGSSGRFAEGLGLRSDMQSYPSAYWKSPFFLFLQINWDAALQSLFKLLDFCTERCLAEFRRRQWAMPSSVSLLLSDGAEHVFSGGARAFSWSQTNTNSSGQLNSALAALERCLTLKMETGASVDADLERILLTATSAGVIGVLTNVGKFKPDLFRGVLRPLVTRDQIYRWDDQRASERQFAFVAPHWARQGEIVFNIAREWHNAPYRQKSMRELIAELARSDSEFASFVNCATATWTAPADQKSALELRILAADIDGRNYQTTAEGDYQFSYPPDLTRDIEAFQNANMPGRQILRIPEWCLDILNSGALLTDAAFEALAGMLEIIDAAKDIEEEFKTRARVAVASTLLTRGQNWLVSHAATREQSSKIIEVVLAGIPTTMEDLRGARLDQAGVLEFVAHAVFKQWMDTGTSEAQATVLQIITSGNKAGVTILFHLGFAYRQELGERWWRLLYLGLLWSALSMLTPRYGYQADEGARWMRWLKWLRSRRLDGIAATSARIQPVEIAKGLERLEKIRWRREFKRGGVLRGPPPDERRTAGLDWDFLEAAFGWLLWDGEEPNLLWDDEAKFQEQRQLIRSLWTFEVWLNHRPHAGHKDDALPNQLGYSVLETIAKMMVKASGARARELWEPILKLGAAGHYAVGHFLSSWFLEASRLDADKFAVRWQPMIEYALNAPEWGNGTPWYYGQRLLRQLLGFGSQALLDGNPAFQGIVTQMAPYYERWAREHLARDDDNVTGLCFFLASSSARSLRMMGLKWLKQAVTTPDWYRPAMGDALIEFLNVTLTEDTPGLRSDIAARDAFLALVALLVSKQLPAGLALQERARRALTSS